MELTSVKERIERLLRYEGLSASQFADEIGVQRPNVSHILSGRNNPSLEFVQKILQRFKHINADWLLFGNGEMKKYDSNQSLFSQNQLHTDLDSSKSEQIATPSIESGSTSNLFTSKNTSDIGVNVVKLHNRKVVSDNIDKSKSESCDISSKTHAPDQSKETDLSASDVKKVKQIVILYEDGTFSIYNK